MERTRAVLEQCARLGFALAGVCEAAPSRHERELREWLGQGGHGSMAWMADHVEERLDPRRVLAGARSIVVVADQYSARRERPAAASSGATPSGEPVGKIARYARGRDYHLEIKRRLHALCDALRADHPAHAFRAFADAAPVLEREHAARAGLGWIGKHTLLIHPRVGSYVLLGGVLTTLHLPAPPEQGAISDHCGSCTRCIEACPTGAISERRVDAARCISYLTIEHRGAIEPALASHLDGWLFGCDVCQEVCPHNSARPEGVDVGAVHAAYAPRFESLPLLEVLRWTPADRARVLSGSAMKRARLDMLKRTAILLLEREARGAGGVRVREALRALQDDSPLVMSTRDEALARLDALDTAESPATSPQTACAEAPPAAPAPPE